MAKNSALFQNLMDGMMSAEYETGLIDDCMSFDMNVVEKVPLRYRLIALAFVRGSDLADLNEKLKAEGCAELYSRSFWEAGLIYAFSHKKSYEEWQALEKECEDIRSEIGAADDAFSGSQITLADLRSYVERNSLADNQLFYTRHLTHEMEEKITGTEGTDSFRQFLSDNVRAFTAVREKTRYYFCKYLLHFLDNRVAQYVSALQKGIEVEDALEALSVLKGLTTLRRKKMTPEDAKAYLETCAISCGEIFDAFNYYYFEYVSLDWIEVQLEYYGNIDDLPAASKQKLAGSLRHYNKAYRKMSDAEILSAQKKHMEEEEKKQDEIYSLDGGSRGYQRNRSGENAIRKFIKGSLDPDRVTLITFLLFFGSEGKLSEGMEISETRLSNILIECGYPGLRESDVFDRFVMEYLRAKDPSIFLMEEVTKQAMNEENSYLFRVYRSAGSYESEWLKLMGIQ